VSGASNQKPLLVLDVMLRPPGADLRVEARGFEPLDANEIPAVARHG
jgi:hypothetical protein